ncbi:MAG TPA: hypothetical protein VG411_08170 [Actinomycetota bacterium]|nr:hypothetical protein [Actinomycetota bacterium]
MCTEKCFELTRGVTRRGALLGGVAVAASAALQGTAHAGERGADERDRRSVAGGAACVTSPTR